MKKSSSSPLAFPSLPLTKVGFVLGSLALGEWAMNDLVHLPTGSLAVLAAGAGVWFLSKPSKNLFQPPSSVSGWIRRCKEVLSQFESLEDERQHGFNDTERKNSLDHIINRTSPQTLALVGTAGVQLPEISSFQTSIAVPSPLKLTWSASLPIQTESWKIPEEIFEKDSIIYFLPLPLRAVDLLWLEQIPEDQPSWIMVNWDDQSSWQVQSQALTSQLPDRWVNRVLRWNGIADDMKNLLSPVRRFLNQSSRNIDLTRQRLLSRLHSSWQSDLENLRREKFKSIQTRSQWLVAGAVFASPVPSTDLLSVAVVNGLMIQEMGNLWSCNFRPDLLKEVARQLALAALAQGVVEWSGQALLGFAKLHGGTWVAAGTMQALSAAYLTRVVGRSMADWMAMNNGVSKPDLELLKLQASELVSKAADSEKVDWSLFAQQANVWVKDKMAQPNLQNLIV